MAAPAPEHVRNIVLVGQDGAGKTSLAEAMLFVSGKTPRMGTTHDGKSYLDYDPEEIKRKFTISTSIAPIPYKDYKINVLDTSGHPDFIGDTLATMQAAEMALFVVDAVDGPQVMTTKLWREAEDMRLSRAVYINHIDRENANFDAAMALLHARFGGRLGAVTIPIGQAEEFRGVIDIIRMEARYFEDGGEVELSPRNLGILMHRAFEQADDEAGIHEAVRGMQADGTLSEADAATLRQMIARALEHPEVREWFGGGWERVRNENEIIIPGRGSTRRPDRVMIDGRRVVVVDYKFGLRDAERHRRQMREYLRLLGEMGYAPAEGYLWYVKLGKIEKVEP